jgi:hypothetical protein
VVNDLTMPALMFCATNDLPPISGSALEGGVKLPM